MKIVKYRKIFFSISAVFVLAALLAVLFLGIRPSIDFAGGELFELRSEKSITKQKLESIIAPFQENASVRETGISGAESAFIVRLKELDDKTREELINNFKENSLTLERSSFVGPIIGTELKKKALVAILLTVIAIIAFVAWAFREVSRPVSSWKYGLIAILALLHDIMIPLGVFAILGYFLGAEIDTLFVMALLAILGYSVNDTIVIFDRVRERLKQNKEKKRKEGFEDTVGKALDSTIVRSINTSLTTALVILALYFLGPESTKYFALTLLAGVLAGTYSSIFLAAPLLVDISKLFPEKEKPKSKPGPEVGVMKNRIDF